MASIPITESIVKAFTNGVPNPPNINNKEYRYYHCHLDWNGLKCTKVDGPSVLPAQDYTKLLFVKSYIPEIFDTQILKYKWLPNRVHIVEKST